MKRNLFILTTLSLTVLFISLVIAVSVGVLHAVPEPLIPTDDAEYFNRPPVEIPSYVKLPSTPKSLSLTLSARSPSFIHCDQGPAGVVVREEQVHEEGFEVTCTGSSGEPNLAQRVVNVLLPYDADIRTLRISIDSLETTLVSSQPIDILPIGEKAYYDPKKEKVEIVEPEGRSFDDQGRDVVIYKKNQLWPQKVVDVAGFSAKRQYRYVRLHFSPFQWNPITKKLYRNTSVNISLSWSRLTNIDVEKTLIALSDPVKLWELAPEYFVNHFDIIPWYFLEYIREGSYNYVIVTTDAIRSSSAKLNDFVSDLTNRGKSVAVVGVETIEQFYPASERADSIRAFLQDRYSDWGIAWLLLIGDPDPYDIYVGAADRVGSVPMKMAWPRGEGLIGYDDDGNPKYGNCPTDHYYGELSGNWDVDGDGYAADDDEFISTATGYIPLSLDLDMELKVGRIPYDDTTKIDKVLSRTMNYKQQDPASSPDLTRVYVACSFLDSQTDYAYLGRQIHDEVFSNLGLSVVTFYQPASSFSSGYALQDTALIDKWENRSAGLVLWAGHGNYYRTSIGYDGAWDGYIMRDSDTPNLDNIPNSFVFQASCSNGKPEEADNLAHCLLYENAVATIAASYSSYYHRGQEDFNTGDETGDLAYRAMKWIAKGRTAGNALQIMRYQGSPNDEYDIANLLTYNLYGDPLIRYQY